MERIRVLERKCLRASVNKYFNFTTQKRISNTEIYNLANVHRFDNFIVKLIRDHYYKVSLVKTNNLISGALYTNDLYCEKTRLSGYIAPEAFLHLDREGFIQNKDNIPIIYHMYRRATDKKIQYSVTDIEQGLLNNVRFSTRISNRDMNYKINSKRHFWLQ